MDRRRDVRPEGASLFIDDEGSMQRLVLEVVVSVSSQTLCGCHLSVEIEELY